MKQFRALIAGDGLVQGQEVVEMPCDIAVGAGPPEKRLPKLATWVAEHAALQGTPVLVSRDVPSGQIISVDQITNGAELVREATREERMRPNPNKVDRPFNEIGRPYPENHTEPLKSPPTNVVFPKSNWELSFREWPNFAVHYCNLEVVAVNPRLGVTTELILTDRGLHISNAKPA